MKKENRKNLYAASGSLLAFVLWTAALCFVNVDAIGPRGSEVGFSAFNQAVHSVTGTHMSLYVITDWLGLVPVAFMFCFALFGLFQWVKRKKFCKVDFSILILGGFYIAVMAVYILFENFVVNYRPVLIDGFLEASYPSSTTMLVMCVMPTAAMQLNGRIKSSLIRRIMSFVITAFTAFMVVGRLISGVHWVTDIIGGILVSFGLVMMYSFVCSLKK